MHVQISQVHCCGGGAWGSKGSEISTSTIGDMVAIVFARLPGVNSSSSVIVSLESELCLVVGRLRFMSGLISPSGVMGEMGLPLQLWVGVPDTADTGLGLEPFDAGDAVLAG